MAELIFITKALKLYLIALIAELAYVITQENQNSTNISSEVFIFSNMVD